MVDNNVADHSMSGDRDHEVELIVSSIRGKLHQQPPLPDSSCIFRVPDILRRHNENAFDPNIVSIGPFHHGKKNLQAMEEIKLWYLHCLLDRKPTPETRLEYFVEVITDIEQDCRACYGEKIDMDSRKFVEMMLVDACFIIEFFRKKEKEVPRVYGDPMFNTYWMQQALMKDLFLLENQIPWEVVDCLFLHTKKNDELEKSCILQLALKCFEMYSFGQDPQLDGALNSQHLLDAIRNSLISKSTKEASDGFLETIPSVTELLQAGVEFKIKSTTWDNMFDITFENGVMKIPQILIKDSGESLFRNLIAYEQCDRSIAPSRITSYSLILDNLINSSEDADYLIQRDIIATKLSKEDIASIFNRLYSDTLISNFCYDELVKNVNTYYKGRWHKWQAILSRDYFSNPWSIFSFVAALVILVLTFLQTFYSILTYY